MGEVVSQRTSGLWTGRRRMIPPHVGWRDYDISMIVSGVRKVKLEPLSVDRLWRRLRAYQLRKKYM